MLRLAVITVAIGAAVLPAPALAQERPAPLPIMVAVQTAGRVAPELAAAAQQALVDRLTAMAGGRPVHALANEEVLAAIAACGDDACQGAILGQANAQAGVYLRLRARGRRPLEASIEVRDPISGALRMAAVTGELPLDAAQIPAAMEALSAQLAPAVPPPPPPPATLLVTVNVDGANVRIDGQDAGTSPVAPIEVEAGPHDIAVSLRGYQAHRRRVEVRAGEQARVDVTLSAAGAITDVGDAREDGDPGFFREPAPAADVTSEWWFWTAIGGGAAVVLAIVIGVAVGVATSAPSAPQNPMGIELPPIIGM